MALTIRRLTPADRERAHALRGQVFAVHPAPFDADEVYVPDDRRVGAFVDGELAGVASVWDLGQYYGQRRVACGGVAGVAVAPEWRRRGLGSELLQRALGEMRARGEAISTLYPLTAPLYRHLGWEFAGVWLRRRVPTVRLAELPAPARPTVVRRAGPEDREAMAAVAACAAVPHNGNLGRSTTFNRRRLALDGDEQAFVAHRDGDTVGYLVYRHRPTADDAGLYRYRVDDLIALDLDAEIALWRLLGQGAPAADLVEFVSRPADPLLLALREDALTAPPRTWHWMTRLVDAPAAVAARGYRRQATATVHLDLSDPNGPWHSGPHVLEVAGGDGRLQPGGRGDVSVDVGALAAIWTGWARPADLAGVGRLRGASAADLEALSDVFGGPTPWLREFF